MNQTLASAVISPTDYASGVSVSIANSKASGRRALGESLPVNGYS
jgi:hypothetical protein